jgi:hypothetical protein
MSVTPPWVKLGQQGCEDRARSLRQPLWLKVSYMAYSRVGANGCAPFPKREELAKLLGKRRQDIDRAIRTAIGYGFLEEASCAECLCPPGDFVESGMGSSRKECAVHPRDGTNYALSPAPEEERSIEGRSVAAGQGENVKHSVLQTEALSAANPIHSVLQGV